MRHVNRLTSGLMIPHYEAKFPNTMPQGLGTIEINTAILRAIPMDSTVTVECEILVGCGGVFSAFSDDKKKNTVIRQECVGCKRKVLFERKIGRDW